MGTLKMKYYNQKIGIIIYRLLFIILLFIVLDLFSDVRIFGPYNEITGKWNWIKTEKMNLNNILETPKSVGYSHQLEFKDKEVRIYYAGTLKEISNYVIENGLIKLPERKFYFNLKSDTLILGRAYTDGPVKYYKKL